MKKIINKMFIVGVCFFAFSSCKKGFLEKSPTDQVSTEVLFSTTKNAWAAVNGIHRLMYNQLFGSQPQGGQSGNMLYMEAMGEDFVFNTSSNNWLLNEYKWVSHRNPNSNMLFYNYQFYYIIIGNANTILANIDNADGSDADKAAIKGEALTYRGWAYYQMVQLFGERYVDGQPNSGLAVPLVVNTENKKLPRSTVADVYIQINADLDNAITSLAGYNRTNKSHFDVNIAKGIKARVALTQQKWVDAIKYAKEARVGYPLMTNAEYLGGFNDYSNKEWMWSSRIASDQTNYFYSFFAYMSANFNASAIRNSIKSINSKLYNAIPATDIRKSFGIQQEPTRQIFRHRRQEQNGINI